MRHVFLLALGGVCAVAAVHSAGSFTDSIRGLRAADVDLLVVAAGLCALSFPSAAVAQRGAAPLPLRLGPLVLVQVACAFTGRLLPAGMGTLATNGRYLRRVGLPAPAAAAAASLNGATGFAIHALSLLVAAPWLLTHSGVTRPAGLPAMSDEQTVAPVAICALLVFAGALVVLTSPRVAALLARAVKIVRSATVVLRDPRKVAELLTGSCGVTALHAATFAVCVHATGGRVRWLDLVALYVVAAAVAAIVPTPGGLGALDAALVLGLAAVGTPAVAAAAGVLWFRLLTFWAPAIPGLAAFGLLLHRRQL